MNREEFGQRFKAAREAAGIRQSQAAKMLGVRRQRIAEYDRGICIPPMGRLLTIISTLGLDPKILLPELSGHRRRAT